jgi:uncharacterized RDD family membrane protein YckC
MYDTQSKLGQYAGLFSRLAAFILDAVFISVTIMFVTWFASFTMETLQTGPIFDFLTAQAPSLKRIADALSSRVAAGFYALIFVFLYHVLFLSFAGQTPGKALMGIRVVPLRGGKVSLWRAILRYLGYYLSGALLGFGFFWILIDDRRLGWHDKIARTCVIYTWDARPDETFLVYATQQLIARRDSLRTFVSRRKSIDSTVIEDFSERTDQGDQLRSSDA